MSDQTARVYGFVDGAFLRTIAAAAGHSPYDPQFLIERLIHSGNLNWIGGANPRLSRILYFDGEPDDNQSPSSTVSQLEAYWKAVELLYDTHLAFGWVRGKASRRGPRQKAVDTLLAVEMVAGAYTGRFDAAILIAGDADFVPIVNEVRRAGPHVVVAAATDKSAKPRFVFADELRRSADRSIELPTDFEGGDYKGYFKPLIVSPE